MAEILYKMKQNPTKADYEKAVNEVQRLKQLLINKGIDPITGASLETKTEIAIDTAKSIQTDSKGPRFTIK